jgi:hypothetical protein
MFLQFLRMHNILSAMRHPVNEQSLFDEVAVGEAKEMWKITIPRTELYDAP